MAVEFGDVLVPDAPYGSNSFFKRLRNLGFSHLALDIASESRDKALAALNRRASLAGKLR
jgi:hypothetical protein